MNGIGLQLGEIIGRLSNILSFKTSFRYDPKMGEREKTISHLTSGVTGTGFTLVMSFSPDLFPPFWKLIGISVGFALMAWGFRVYFRQFCLWLKELRMGSVALVSIGLVCVSAGAYALWIAFSTGSKTSTQTEAPYLLLECDIAFQLTTPPPKEPVYVLEASRMPEGLHGGHFSTQYLGELKEWPWPKAPNVVHRCQLTNIGEQTVFDLNFTPKLRFHEAIINPQNHGVDQGRLIVEQDWPVLVAKVHKGVEHPFVFYIINSSEYFLQVKFPDVIMGRPQNKSAAETIRLVDGGPKLVLLSPDPRFLERAAARAASPQALQSGTELPLGATTEKRP